MRLTAKCSATSFFVMFGSNSMAAAFFTSASDMAGFRPPFRPRARAACNPAIVLSRIRSCSNSARAPRIWNTKRPPELVVSMDSVNDLKPISRSWSSWTISTRSFSERASRSSFQTTRISPFRSVRRHCDSSGRSRSLPVNFY